MLDPASDDANEVTPQRGAACQRLFMGENAFRQARGAVGDHGDADDLGTQRMGDGRFQYRTHADHTGAGGMRQLGFGRGLELWAAIGPINTLAHAHLFLLSRLVKGPAQMRIVDLRHIDEGVSEQMLMPRQGGYAQVVDMVLDQHERARRERFVDAGTGVAEKKCACATLDGGPNGQNHRQPTMAFVHMKPTTEYEYALVSDTAPDNVHVIVNDGGLVGNVG